MEKTNKTEEKALRPPYASSGIADAIIDLFRKITASKVDSKFIVDNNIATSSNAFRATDFLKWLGITDTDGNVNSEIAKKLRIVGDERNKMIKELVEKAYKDLFEKVNVTEATKDNVINYFVHNHNFGGPQATQAAGLFLHLCYRYNIPVSEDLKKKTHTGEIKERKKPESRIKSKKEEKTDSLPAPPENNVGVGEVLIEIKGASGLYFPLRARSKEELENIVDNKFKTIIEAVKLTLPDNGQSGLKAETLTTKHVSSNDSR